ncbi:hypothetical protein V5O48_006418 [Marasmius crinis-equi]|uniref:Xylanolytic transcriptional activator regulatory domain-containing protein n=1 Tax=Marasmius crinis-equi TaxID=585013 RepID=A0ABR3FJJ1_9AGAR
MPPDTTKTAPKRREKKPTSPEEIREIEQKRLRASTNQLHSKISAMSARIRALEDGLAIMQATVSSEKHPLLTEELLKIKFGAEVLSEGKAKTSPRYSSEEAEEMQDGAREMPSPRETFSAQPNDTSLGAQARVSQADMSALDTLGTLTLGEEGELKYFGRSAGSQTLMLAGEEYLSDSDSDGVEPFSPASLNDKSPVVPHTSVVTSSDQSPNVPPAITSPISRLSPDTLPAEIYALASGGFSSPPSSNHLSPQSAFVLPSEAQETHRSVHSLLTHLPSSDRGRRLAQSYLDHAAYFFRPLTKWELFGDITLPVNPPDVGILGRVYAHHESPQSANPPSPHLLSTLFFIFALGAFFDLSLTSSQHVHDAEKWFRLGKGALTLSGEPVVTGSTSSSAEETVCALGLMSTCITMTGKKYSRDHAWCGMSLAVKIAEGAGLHRDPARWNMDPRTVQRRRTLWWEVFSADVSHSLALGRPPSVNLSFVDCEFPVDEEATLKTLPKEEPSADANGQGSDSNGDIKQEIVDGFWRTKYRFSRDCFTAVIDATLTAKAPSYETVLKLDRKVVLSSTSVFIGLLSLSQVREHQLPIKANVSIEEDGEDVYRSSSLTLRDFYGGQYRTVTMLYLHRSFFAHAMLTSPSNPFLSPFAPSFLAAYRAASMLVKAGVQMYDRCPQITGRVWFLMYHVFSAAVVVGTVVTRSPNSTVASSALVDLNLAVELFEKCSTASHRIKVAFILLKKLQEKALRSYSQFMEQTAALSPTSPTSTNGDDGASPPFLAPSSAGSPPINPKILDPNLFSDRVHQDGDFDIEGELEMFGGQTKVLRAKGKCKKARTSSRSPSISVDSPASQTGPPSTSDEPRNGTVRPNNGDTLSASLAIPSQSIIDLDMTLGDGSGTITPVPGRVGFDPAIAFGFGAGTTGTVIGGLNMASMGLDLGMDVDTDMGFDFGLLEAGPSNGASATPGKVNGDGFVSGAELDAENGTRGRSDDKAPGGLVNPLVEYLSGSSMALPAESPASWTTQWAWPQSPVGVSPLSPGPTRNSNGGVGQWRAPASQPASFTSNLATPSRPSNGIPSNPDPGRYDELYAGFLEFLTRRARENGSSSSPFSLPDSQPFGGNPNGTPSMQPMTARSWSSPSLSSPSSFSALPPHLQQWYSQFGQRQAAVQSNITHLQQTDEGQPSFRQDYDLLLQTLGLGSNSNTLPESNWSVPDAM